MINENIRRYRKQRGISQEEMAVKLHVVRQTVSKWENGLSVPDAAVVIEMASLLNVPVTALLGIDTDKGNVDDLAAELARLNERLAKKNQREALVKSANQKRGLIVFLSFVSMLIAMRVKNPVVSIVLSGGCMLFISIYLYRNLALLSSLTTDDLQMKTLRITTIWNMAVLILCMAMAVLSASGLISLSAGNEQLFGMLLIAGIMIFAGIVSPKLPFTRHTGLRLPWTVQDEDTWKLAHRVLGVVSLPVAVLYVTCSLTIADFGTVTLTAVFLWIGIPAVISFAFFWKKIHGRR